MCDVPPLTDGSLAGINCRLVGFNASTLLTNFKMVMNKAHMLKSSSCEAFPIRLLLVPLDHRLRKRAITDAIGQISSDPSLKGWTVSILPLGVSDGCKWAKPSADTLIGLARCFT
jgi:hypothetical protein